MLMISVMCSNIIIAVQLTGNSQLGLIFSCFGEIQVMINFAEKLSKVLLTTIQAHALVVQMF